MGDEQFDGVKCVSCLLTGGALCAMLVWTKGKVVDSWTPIQSLL